MNYSCLSDPTRTGWIQLGQAPQNSELNRKFIQNRNLNRTEFSERDVQKRDERCLIRVARSLTILPDLETGNGFAPHVRPVVISDHKTKRLLIAL